MKMQRTNQKIRKWLVENGYEDIYFFPHSRFYKDYHFQFEDFDGIASHNNKVVLFQCKSNKRAPKKILDRYKRLSERFNMELLWINAIDRKGLEINNG